MNWKCVNTQHRRIYLNIMVNNQNYKQSDVICKAFVTYPSAIKIVNDNALEMFTQYKIYIKYKDIYLSELLLEHHSLHDKQN